MRSASRRSVTRLQGKVAITGERLPRCAWPLNFAPGHAWHRNQRGKSSIAARRSQHPARAARRRLICHLPCALHCGSRVAREPAEAQPNPLPYPPGFRTRHQRDPPPARKRKQRLWELRLAATRHHLGRRTSRRVASRRHGRHGSRSRSPHGRGNRYGHSSSAPARRAARRANDLVILVAPFAHGSRSEPSERHTRGARGRFSGTRPLHRALKTDCAVRSRSRARRPGRRSRRPCAPPAARPA